MAKPKNTKPIKIVSIEIGELKGLVKRAKGLNEEEKGKLEGAVDTLALITQELESKRTSLKRLRRMIFGPSGEKTKDILKDVDKDKEGEDKDTEGEDKDTEGEDKADETAAGNEGAVEASSSNEKGDDKKAKGKRKGHGRIGAAAYTGAKKVSVLAELTNKQKCPDPECEDGKIYRQKKPKVLVRVTGMAPLSATVYELERFRCNICGEIFTAKPPEGVGENKYDNTVAPMLGLLKYGTGLPFYRLAGLQKQLGIPLPAGTQWDILLKAELIYFDPAFKELIRQAAQGTLLYNDDTTMRILDLKRKIVEELLFEAKGGGKKGRQKKRTGIFTSGIVSIGSGHQIALFFTGVKHAGENLSDVLEHRLKDLGVPIQMCDGLAASESGDFETIVANCIAHGRRKFVDVAEAFPDECRYVLESFEAIYQIDAHCKNEGHDAETRLHTHQEHSKKVMDDLKIWLDRQFDEKLVEPNSSLGKAISYLLNRWSKLTLFLTVAGAPLDNNICERAIKKAILHRKNALFYKTKNGARVGDTYMSLIYTCELNGANPFEYMLALQKHHEEVKRTPALWMPWNFEETILNLP